MNKRAVVRARAPLRLGLAGGGTDVSPFCDIHGGFVLNATIDRYAYAIIEPLGDAVAFIAADQQVSESLRLASRYELNGSLDLHKAVYNEIVQSFNHGQPLSIRVTTFCDAPAGSGLGSSSTVVVALIKAFAELLNLPLDDYAIAHLAFRIERIDCKLNGGKQDQYSATFGGFNFMEFYGADRVIVNPLRIKSRVLCDLESSLVLYYTGVSRESAKIIDAQSKNVSSGAANAIEALHAVKQEATIMKDCLLRGDAMGLVDSMRMGWENKKKSAASVSNPMIDEIYDAACAAGALAGKVSGAGGGGFMMFYVQPSLRMNVMRTLTSFGGQASNCHFTQEGCQSWTV